MLCLEKETITIGTKVFYVESADTFFSRLIGLMFKNSYDTDKALHITPCNSIHMFFMRFPITAVFVDKNGVITDFRKNLGVWQVATSFFKGTKSVYEISYFGNENITPVIGENIFSSNNLH